jgi:hypothetical protein
VSVTAVGKEGTSANLWDLASPLTRVMILGYGKEALWLDGFCSVNIGWRHFCGWLWLALCDVIFSGGGGGCEAVYENPEEVVAAHDLQNGEGGGCPRWELGSVLQPNITNGHELDSHRFARPAYTRLYPKNKLGYVAIGLFLAMLFPAWLLWMDTLPLAGDPLAELVSIVPWSNVVSQFTWLWG